MTASAPTDSDILQTIPHRPPFLFLEKIESMRKGESLAAWMKNDPKAAFYEGHYPGQPVMPGALIMEALAQASCYLFVKTIHPPKNAVFYLGNVKLRFLNAAGPKDKILLEIKVKKIISAGAIFEVLAKNSSVEMVSGEIGFMCKAGS